MSIHYSIITNRSKVRSTWIIIRFCCRLFMRNKKKKKINFDFILLELLGGKNVSISCHKMYHTHRHFESHIIVSRTSNNLSAL